MAGLHQRWSSSPAGLIGILFKGLAVAGSGFLENWGVATPKSIQDFYKAYGGHRPPPLDHDGIEDAFVDKASVIKYWYRDRWLDLQGSD